MNSSLSRVTLSKKSFRPLNYSSPKLKSSRKIEKIYIYLRSTDNKTTSNSVEMSSAFLNLRHNLRQRGAERCTRYLQIVSPSEGWESKFHACQWELNKLPLKVSIYRKHGENMLYFWMFPGTMLLSLFLASLLGGTVVNSKRHFLSVSRRIRLRCCFRFCRSSAVLFVHCYTKSMLSSPPTFFIQTNIPNNDPQTRVP